MKFTNGFILERSTNNNALLTYNTKNLVEILSNISTNTESEKEENLEVYQEFVNTEMVQGYLERKSQNDLVNFSSPIKRELKFEESSISSMMERYIFDNYTKYSYKNLSDSNTDYHNFIQSQNRFMYKYLELFSNNFTLYLNKSINFVVPIRDVVNIENVLIDFENDWVLKFLGVKKIKKTYNEPMLSNLYSKTVEINNTPSKTVKTICSGNIYYDDVKSSEELFGHHVISEVFKGTKNADLSVNRIELENLISFIHLAQDKLDDSYSNDIEYAKLSKLDSEMKTILAELLENFLKVLYTMKSIAESENYSKRERVVNVYVFNILLISSSLELPLDLLYTL